MTHCDVSVLQGRTLTSVELSDDRDSIVFRSESGTYVMLHEQDCCEHVFVEDVCGDLADLVGTPILLAEEVSNYEREPPGNADSYTWTFYKFRTARGDVTIRWLGESNGYYSESVSFVRATGEAGVDRLLEG